MHRNRRWELAGINPNCYSAADGAHFATHDSAYRGEIAPAQVAEAFSGGTKIDVFGKYGK